MWMDVKVLNVDNKVSLSTVRCCCCCCKLRGRLLRVLICRSPTQFQSAADHLLRVIYCKKPVGNQILTPPPTGERSIVMSVSVCLSVRDHIFGTTVRSYYIVTEFLRALPMAVARSASCGEVIRYVFPVL